MRKHLCRREGRKAGERTVQWEHKPRWKSLSSPGLALATCCSTYREAVLGDGDAAGLHGDAHALADAACKPVQLVRSLAAVPRGAPATQEHTSEHGKYPGKMSNSTRC